MKKVLICFLIMIIFIVQFVSCYAMDDWANVRNTTIFKYLFYNPVNEGEGHEEEYYNVYYFIDPNVYDPNDKDRFDFTVKQALNNKVLYTYPTNEVEYRFLVGGYLLASFLNRATVDNLALAYKDGIDTSSELLIEAKYALNAIITRLNSEYKIDDNGAGTEKEFSIAEAKEYAAYRKIMDFSNGDLSLDIDSINATEDNHKKIISFFEKARDKAGNAFVKAGGKLDDDKEKEDKESWEKGKEKSIAEAIKYDTKNTAPLYYIPEKTGSKNEDKDSTDIDTVVSSANTFINNKEEDSVETIKEEDVKKLSDSIYNILLIVGVIIAVIVGAIIGIKFMTGSIEQKASIKELLIPYIVGCVVVFGAFGIWKIVVLMLKGI